MSATIVWFRQDLRLADNPALIAAIECGGPVIPVYILDEVGENPWPAGGASRWWLHHSLARLDDSLRERGSRLVLVRGRSDATLQALLRQTGATAVYWNHRYEPAVMARDKTIKSVLGATGIDVKSFNSALLFEPHTVRNKAGGPFQVFTPFWKHCLALSVEPVKKLAAGDFTAPVKWPVSLKIAELELRPKIAWDASLTKAWQPGEATALKRMKQFVRAEAGTYDKERDFPGVEGTSVLSPHLHFGEIGPRQIWTAARALSEESGVFPADRGTMVFLKEVGWREFAYHLLYHFPQTPEAPLRSEFAAFPWRNNAAQLDTWRKGLTGYPIVDAGMRQLWATGWMHNRVRMIVASFLVKHLRISWQEGAAWFWDMLVDADLASNTLGWQWSSGCGADAAPYFRIFNPVLQGRKFDADGAYVRRWVPELEGLSDEYIHQPWEAPAAVLAAAGLGPGGNYPAPVVDHGEARRAALAALQSLRKERSV